MRDIFVIAWRQQVSQANIDKLWCKQVLIGFVFQKQFHDMLRPKFQAFTWFFFFLYCAENCFILLVN